MEEKERYEVLKSLIPPQLVDKILAEKGIGEPERRPVTVLFADLSGFTALAERMDAEEVRALTNECLEAMARAVFKYEGYVDKFIGDAVMALFGAPVAHEDDPERALRCALEMREAIREISSALPSDIGSLALHAGVHTGEVVAGSVGPDLRLEYTVMGDTVNLASRLADEAQLGQIPVSERTLRLTRGIFEFAEVPLLQVKGKAAPVVAYTLLGLQVQPQPTRGIAGLFSPVVGREQEFEQLREVLETLVAGKGQIVTVMGEPGIGKSRLVGELRAAAQNQPGEEIIWLEGRYLPYGGAIAYWPFLEMLKQWAGVEEVDGEAQVREKLRLALRRLLPDRLDETYPFLATLLALKLDPASQEKVKYLDPEALQTRIHLAVRDWLEALGEDKSAVLVFEDLHWADPSTATLLSYLLGTTERASVMFVLVSRPERDRPWWEAKARAEKDYPHRYSEISLKPLTATQSDVLVQNLLAVEDLPGGVKASIVAKAEGNPFFLEEILRALIDERVVVHQDGHWRATARVLSLEVPDTVQGVILARIDRLPPQPRKVLQMASVIGRYFLYRILASIAYGEGQLDEPLTRLQQVELIQEKARRPELEYLFKHALTQEVAYSTLLHEKRRAVHYQVAQAIEQLFPDRLEEFYGLLAHHYTQAEDREKAIQYLIKAGDRAKAAYANQESLSYYLQAYGMLKESEKHAEQQITADVLMKLGDIHRLMMETEKALTRLEEARSRYHALRERRMEAEVLYRLSAVHHGHNEYLKAESAAQEGLSIAEALGDPSTIARGYRHLAAARHWGGIHQAQARADIEKALFLFEAVGELQGLGDAHRIIGLMSMHSGEGTPHYLKAAEYHLQAGDLESAAIDYNNAATDYYDVQAEFHEALDYTQRGFELAKKAGAIRPYGVLHTTLSEIHTLLGNWEDAQRAAAEGLEIAKRIDNRQLECFCEMDLGWVALGRGDLPEAVERLSRAIHLSTYTAPFYQGMFQHMSLGQLDQAQEHLERSLAIAQDIGSHPLRGVAQRGLGTWHAALSAWGKAEKAYQKSLQVWEELEDPGMQRSRTLRDYGLMLLQRGGEGDEARGREMLKEAIGFFRSKDDQFDLIWAERELAKLGRTLEEIGP